MILDRGDWRSVEQKMDICVDLDGTLVAGDTLWDNFAVAIRSAPQCLPSILRALMGGRARFKESLGKTAQVDPALLPYRDTLLTALQGAKQAGHRLWLVTAAHQSIADGVAAHLGIFDGAFGTSGGRNLKGEEKAKFLCEMFGRSRFTYVGDSRADIPVWRDAETAWVVGAGLARRVARETGKMPVVFAESFSQLRAWWRLLRPHQWSKNLLVFAPMLAGHRFTDVQSWGGAFVAFFAFSLAASSTYIFNDFLDVESDRRHPSKRFRALAAGQISVVHALLVAFGLLAAAIGGAFLVQGFTVVVVTYIVCTWIYSSLLKTIALVDVFALSFLYTLRVIGGGIATNTVPSPWLLAFCTFQFLGLAFLKRFTEFARTPDSSFRGYHAKDSGVVLSLGIAASFGAALVLALWVNSETALRGYSRPLLLWAVVPVVLLWNSRAWVLANRGRVHDDPIVFAIRDRGSAVLAAIAAVLFAVSL